MLGASRSLHLFYPFARRILLDIAFCRLRLDAGSSLGSSLGSSGIIICWSSPNSFLAFLAFFVIPCWPLAVRAFFRLSLLRVLHKSHGLSCEHFSLSLLHDAHSGAVRLTTLRFPNAAPVRGLRQSPKVLSPYSAFFSAC